MTRVGSQRHSKKKNPWYYYGRWMSRAERWFIIGKVKVKCTLVQVLRLCKGRTAHKGSTPWVDHEHGTRSRWGVSFTLRPLFTPGKEPVLIVQEVGWPEGRSGKVRKISPPPGFDPRTIQLVASRYTDWPTRPTLIIGARNVSKFWLFFCVFQEYTENLLHFYACLKAT
jgi:hypothetical protein